MKLALTCAAAGPAVHLGQQRLEVAQLEQAVEVAAPGHAEVALGQAAAQALALRPRPPAVPRRRRMRPPLGRHAVRLVLQRLLIQR